MTLEECYRALGGSYSDVLARLVNDKMITKYLNKFTEALRQKTDETTPEMLDELKSSYNSSILAIQQL